MKKFVFNRSGFWIITVRIVWLVALAGLVVRFACGGFRRVYAFNDYMLAGLHWMRGEYLYGNWRGFIYSPVIAAFFAPFSYLPPAFAYALWLLVNAGALLGGLSALFKTNLFPDLDQKCLAMVCLLILPLGLGNLDVGQANPLVVGLLMCAIAAVRVNRWSIAALCIAIPTFFKIYPLAIGMLICAIAPRRFGWRLLLALLLFAVAPFLFQHWSYVSDQYHAWIETRISDNRLNYPDKYVPVDLWFLLHWVGHLPIPPWFYALIQAGTGIATALLCIWGTWKNWKTERVLVGLFFLGSVWMPLCGPATESHTYFLMAPALVIALVQSFRERQPTVLCALLSLAFALQLINHDSRTLYLFHFKQRWVFSAQPLSALLFLGCCVFWLLNDSFWPEERPSAAVRSYRSSGVAE
ncbi:MAG TPA: glycosyltransferase family 87 protein [Chthoniobacterales bacterium]